MVTGLLRVAAIICTAVFCGKLVSKFRLPAILGWLIGGIIFGPYLAEVVTLEITETLWYKVMIKFFECFAGVMIGREIVFKKLAKSGKQIIGITFVQSIGTFLFVTAAFSLVFAMAGIPIYLAAVFGGIALATAPAPALSIVNEYHTSGPVTKTLLPLAAIDDVIGVVVFFTVISIVSGAYGDGSVTPAAIVGIVLFPFVIGILMKAEPVVTKYLGFTLLPHSGVSLVFTGIAAATLIAIDPSLASIVSGTIVAAAIINEIIAVIVAKFAFKWAGEM